MLIAANIHFDIETDDPSSALIALEQHLAIEAMQGTSIQLGSRRTSTVFIRMDSFKIEALQ